MEKPVDQQPGRLFGVVPGLRQDLAAHRLEVLAQLCEGGHGGAFGPSAQKPFLLFLDDAPGLDGLGLAGGAPFEGHRLQVAETIEECVLDTIDGGIDVAGHSGIDQEYRFPAPPRFRLGNHVGGHDTAPRAIGGDNDVEIGETRAKVGIRGDVAIELAGYRFGPRFRRVGGAEGAEAGRQHAARHHDTHFAGPHQQPRATIEITVQVAGHLHGGSGYGNRTLADGGFAAHPLGGAVSGLEDGLEFAAAHAGVAGQVVAGLDLAQHFGLSGHQAVQRRRDPEDVPDGLLAGQDIKLLAEFPGGQAGVVRHDLGDSACRHRAVLGNCLHLDAVAGGQDHGLPHARGAQALDKGRHVGILDE